MGKGNKKNAGKANNWIDFDWFWFDFSNLK